MFDRILVATDGSEHATTALDHALDVAAARDAAVHVLYVADTRRDSVSTVGGEVVDALEHEGSEIVESAVERARDRGVDAESEVLQGEPHSTIVDCAADRDADLVVLGAQGRGRIERALLGSVTERVVRTARTPVLVVPPAADRLRYPYRRVLVPTDGSPGAKAALDAGIDAAGAAGATLHLLSVVTDAGLGLDVRSPAAADAARENAEDVVAEAADAAQDAGLDAVTAVEEGSVHDTILDYVDSEDVDLVAVGTHGRTGLDRYLLGSVTEKLLRTAPVPVLAVRADGE